MDPLRRLQPGDSVAGHLRSAQRHNLLSDAARIVIGNQRSQVAPPPIPGGMASGLVQIKNTTDEAVDRFGVLQIDSVFPDPADNLVAFKAGRVLRGIEPTGTSNDKVAVLLEPLDAGAIGLAMVSGVTVVQVDVINTGENYCRLEEANCANLVSSEASGPGWILWGNVNTGVQWCVVLLGVPLWTPPRTVVTVVTDVQVDATNRAIQIKTQDLDVIDIDTGTESAWTTIHTGTACP